MNLEEIKTWRYQNPVYVDYNGSSYLLNPKVAEMFGWLVDEVERLTPFEHEYCGEYVKDAIAHAVTRCIEIAEGFDDLEDPDNDGIIYGADVAEAIRKEFNCETGDV